MTLKKSITLFALMTFVAACGDKETYLPGPREDLRAPQIEEGEAPVVEADRSEPIRFANAVNHSAWTHRGGSSSHLVAHPAFSSNPSLIWSVNIGEGDGRRHRITADPVAADGRIFVMDSRSQVTAVSETGAILWTQSAVPGHENPDDASGGGLAVAGGHVYVTTGFGTVLKLDAATGAVLWTHRLDASATSAPTVQGELVYVKSRDSVASTIEHDNGRLRWTLRGIPSGAVYTGGPGAVVRNDIAVFPFASGDLISAFPRGGVRRWASSIAGERAGAAHARVMDITGDPVVSGGTLYAGSSSGRLAAIEISSGERIWTAQDGATGMIWPAGGSVFAISDQNILLRMDARNGERIWGSELSYYQRQNRPRRRQGIDVHYGPVVAGGLVWVATGTDSLIGFNPEDGSLATQVALPEGATTNMAFVNGTMYVVNTKGQLLAFR